MIDNRKIFPSFPSSPKNLAVVVINHCWITFQDQMIKPTEESNTGRMEKCHDHIHPSLQHRIARGQFLIFQRINEIQPSVCLQALMPLPDAFSHGLRFANEYVMTFEALCRIERLLPLIKKLSLVQWRIPLYFDDNGLLLPATVCERCLHIRFDTPRFR